MRGDGSGRTIFHILPFLILIFGFLTGTSTTGRKLGVLYDCKSAIIKGIFAAPSEKTWRDSCKSNKLIKYRLEVRKYQVVRTTYYAYYCDTQHIVKECDENFLGDNVKTQLGIKSQYT